MIAWLRIASEPVRNFVRDERAFDHVDAGEARHVLLRQLGKLRSTTDAETTNVTVTLANESGQCAALFAMPPLAAIAEIHDETGLRFSGTVSTVSLGEDCTIEIAA